MKKCPKCNIEKQEIEFHKCKSRKDGLNGWCKICKRNNDKENSESIKKKARIYRGKNKDHIKKYQEEYREINSEKIKEQQHINYIKNKEHRKNCSRENYNKNKDKLAGYNKKYRSLNSEKIKVKKREYVKKRKLNDPSFKVKISIVRLFKLGLYAKGKIKQNAFLSYTGVTYIDYITYFENNYPVEFAEITEKGKYHIDHIIPCAVYDFNNPDHIKLCWQPENLRIISASENLSKSSKIDFDLIRKHNIEHLLPTADNQ